MSKQRLYLFVGYPGAGKTTVAKFIAETTGAVHLWADHERQEQFGETYRPEDSETLYARLNQKTDELLETGKSVVFDTNFNYFRDRQMLRDIARRHGAEVKLVWVKTPKDLAYHRAITRTNGKRLFVTMSHDDFERVASHLEPPRADEQAIEIDGSQIDATTIKQQLDL